VHEPKCLIVSFTRQPWSSWDSV